MATRIPALLKAWPQGSEELVGAARRRKVLMARAAALPLHVVLAAHMVLRLNSGYFVGHCCKWS